MLYYLAPNWPKRNNINSILYKNPPDAPGGFCFISVSWSGAPVILFLQAETVSGEWSMVNGLLKFWISRLYIGVASGSNSCNLEPAPCNWYLVTGNRHKENTRSI